MFCTILRPHSTSVSRCSLRSIALNRLLTLAPIHFWQSRCFDSKHSHNSQSHECESVQKVFAVSRQNTLQHCTPIHCTSLSLHNCTRHVHHRIIKTTSGTPCDGCAMMARYSCHCAAACSMHAACGDNTAATSGASYKDSHRKSFKRLRRNSGTTTFAFFASALNFSTSDTKKWRTR